jgi:hypothetical protein
MEKLPIRGTITSWEPADSIGRIRLNSGEEIRFGHSACVGLRPSLGAEVWVVEVAPHPLGGLRAKVLNATGEATPDRATAALASHEERERLRPLVEAEITAIKLECATSMEAKPSLWSTAAAAGASVEKAVAEMESLRARMPAIDLSASLSLIRAIHRGAPDDNLRLFEVEWADAWTFLEIWTDPCFVPMIAEGSNHIGLYVHPRALDGGSVPVLFRYHEHDPVFAWVAQSPAHFVAMIEAAGRGEDVEPLRGQLPDACAALIDATMHEEECRDQERKDVHALLWSGARVLEEAAAERLAKLYWAREWSFALASIEAQQALASWQDRIDRAMAKLG